MNAAQVDEYKSVIRELQGQLRQATDAAVSASDTGSESKELVDNLRSMLDASASQQNVLEARILELQR
jgi:hypothetical protein